MKHKLKIHEKVELVRKRKGVTKSHIAKRCGKTPTWYTDISNGRRGMSVESLQQIADALEVDIKVFFDENLSESHKKEVS